MTSMRLRRLALHDDCSTRAPSTSSNIVLLLLVLGIPGFQELFNIIEPVYAVEPNNKNHSGIITGVVLVGPYQYLLVPR